MKHIFLSLFLLISSQSFSMKKDLSKSSTVGSIVKQRFVNQTGKHVTIPTDHKSADPNFAMEKDLSKSSTVDSIIKKRFVNSTGKYVTIPTDHKFADAEVVLNMSEDREIIMKQRQLTEFYAYCKRYNIDIKESGDVIRLYAVAGLNF